MYSVAILTLVLVAFASVSPSQSEQVSSQNVNSVPNQSQNVPVVGNSPVAQPSVVGSSGVEVSQPSNIEQPPYYHHVPSSMASYYSPAGMINVVSDQSPQVKPVPKYEQYGQPESASIPANYKPFGSWGLYIGGNPADGYYTNYYKALSNNVEKAGVEQVKPAVGQSSVFSPIIKQAGSSPYVGGEYYPFAYSPAELNSVGSPIQSTVVPHSTVIQGVSPVQQQGPQIYGSPVAFEPTGYGVSSYADSYATKKLGEAFSQKEAKVAQAPAKSAYQSRVYVYPSVMASPPQNQLIGQLSAPVIQNVQPGMQQQGSQQSQVVSYPVPVGSQIVGSQPGVEGSFSPYGVHAFTRYAVKPVMNQGEPNYYYTIPSGASTYKQQVYQSQPSGGYYYYSNAYPMNQLHYSQGSIVPSSMHGEHSHSPVQPSQIDAIEKSEVDDKSVGKPQKRA